MPIDRLLLAASLSWIEAGLLIFFGVFVLIAGWALLQRRGAFDRHARIPLDDDSITTPRHPDTNHADHEVR